MHCRATKDVNTSETTRSEMLLPGEGGGVALLFQMHVLHPVINTRTEYVGKD